MKWYEQTDSSNDVFTAARIRVVRNLSGTFFPETMEREARRELTGQLRERLGGIGDQSGERYRYLELSECTEGERQALKERRVIGQAMVAREQEAGLFLSEDEAVGVGLNGNDHIRIQKFGLGADVNRLWSDCDQLDDWINERFAYAWDEKYGYLTAFPTNMGTGLKASVILHLPFLAEGKKFRGLIDEAGRFGIRVRGLLGQGQENYGALYEVSNNKTLGQSEEEICSLVYRIASHLAVNERKMRSLALRENRLTLEDQACKAYGVLSYAKCLSAKEALIYLSHLRIGIGEGLLQVQEPVNVFGLMWDSQEASVRDRRIGELTVEECNMARAESIRARLPLLD